MTKIPKILSLSPDLPFPIVAGGQMRMASLCEGLSKCCRLHIACIAPAIPEATLDWAKELNVTIESFRHTDFSNLQLLYQRINMIITRNNLKHHRRAQHFFNDVFNHTAPDIVWLETPYLIRYTLEWMKKIPIVVDYWGTSEGAKRIFMNTSGIKRIKTWFIWWTAYGGELRYSKRLKEIVCVSRLDAEYFQRIAPHCRTWPIPNGIIKQYQKNGAVPLHTEHEQNMTMIFTGDLSYLPNIDAALFFADRIFPRIKKELPEVVFRMVGRNPSQAILRLKGTSGMEVLGFVPDLSTEILRSSIYVLPMRLGSGIRSKLFDVFPLAKAIVTTSIGAEGLELHHGENCLIADEEMDFAQCCIHLLKDEGKRVKLGNEAKRLATDVYTQENINLLIKEVVAEVMCKRQR
ncbi:glycosyltransferase family 4 protein [Patescibacteria group bacterium]|nr:glycosyltransferase family 4 protein [Patescibacteria group bacterium]